MMVIGSLFRDRPALPTTCAVSLAFILLALRGVADDQIVKTTGITVSGKIVSVGGGQVMVESVTPSGGKVKAPVFLADIKSVSMTTPAEVTKAQAPGTAPGQVIALLEAPVKVYAGLPVQWVVDAMAQLGDAYSQVGQTDKALAVYNQIGTLYPGSAYTSVADASKAQVSLEAGKIDEALKIVQPIVDKANQNMSPSPLDGATFAKAFLVHGRAMAAQKKYPQALEDFLTVKTMFYQNPATVAEAEHYAKDLRDKNKDLGVE